MASFSEPLLLGVSDGPCPVVHLSPFDNKIGGYPDFFPESQLETAPSCSNCHGLMLHLLQAYCPQEGSIYHRILHVFCCSQPLCWKSNNGWLVLRSQRKDTPIPSTLPSTNQVLSVDEWCDGADDWGNGIQEPSPPSFELTQVTNTLEQLQLNSSKESTRGHTYTGIAYPSYYISVISANEYEVDDSLEKEKELLKRYYLEESTHQKNMTIEGQESYEKSTKDKFFKFQKEMSKFPQQLIRYQHGGNPLVLEEIQTIPQCIYCGSSCVFELQLLPQIIHLLQEGLKIATASDPNLKNLILPVVEYGTLLVYTCQNSCWSDEECNQFRKENLIVQQIDEERLL